MKKRIINIFILLFSVLCLSAQWTSDPLVNTVVNNMSGSQAIPLVSYDNAGNFYVGFFSNESGNYNVRLQYYNFAGVEQWATGGITVSSHNQYGSLTIWDLTTDNNGNCIMAFQDIRTGNPDIHAYAISPSGSFLWGADGISLTNNADAEYLPSIAITSTNDAIIAWQSPGATYKQIVMQKISPSGSVSWGAGIVYQSGSYSYTAPKLLGVENGNYLMAFYKETGSFPGITRHIYAQKFNSLGTAVWGADAVVTTSNGVSPYSYNPTILSDNANGLIVAWTDDRNGDNNIDAAVQHILNDGTTNWPVNGALANTSTANSNQNPKILGVNSSGEVIVAWDKKNSNQSQTAIAGQKFSTTGVQQWAGSGIDFIPMSSDIAGTIGGVVYDGTNAIISYDEFVGGSASHIKAIGVNDAGTLIWAPTITFMAGRATSKVHALTSSLYNNQMVVVWEDAGNDIYMQNIYTDGSMGNPPISNDATLSDLTVDGVTIPGFSPDVFNYVYPVVTGDPIPVADGTTNDPLAMLTVTQAQEIPGDAILVIVAEDGVTELTYTVHFYTLANDATLLDLTVDDVIIEGFDPLDTYYEVDVPEGDPIPVIDGTPNDSLASLEITQATDVPGEGSIIVTAQDGITQMTYIVKFNLITNVFEMDHANISIFPNPVTNQLHISGLRESVQIEIFNILGEKVKDGDLLINSYIELSVLKNGVYFVKIQDKKGNKRILKFLKN